MSIFKDAIERLRELNPTAIHREAEAKAMERGLLDDELSRTRYKVAGPIIFKRLVDAIENNEFPQLPRGELAARAMDELWGMKQLPDAYNFMESQLAQTIEWRSSPVGAYLFQELWRDQARGYKPINKYVDDFGRQVLLDAGLGAMRRIHAGH